MTTRHDATCACAPGSRGGRPTSSTAIKSLFIAALAAFSAAALSGCEEQRYPTPSAEQTPPPAPPPPAPLMGAPSPSAPPPYSPCADDTCGQSGPPAPEPQPMIAPRVIASTPVPNPPEPTPYHHHRHHRRIWMYGETQPVAPHHHIRHASSDGRWHVVGPAPTQRAKAVVAPTPSAPAAHPHHPPSAAKPSAATPAGRTAPKAAGAAPPAGAAIGNITDNTSGAAAGADTDHYNTLQLALSNLVGVEAVLATPDRFQPGQTQDVTLTLPASFAQEAHDEAAKAGITEAASSVNIDAHLTGTGYTVAPDQAQSQPLLLGQPTVFHWKVTPTAEAAGAVKADLTADLQTVGRSLPLGSIKSQAGAGGLHLSGRLVGVALLMLVLVVVAAWIVSRSGKGPAFRRKDI